jgi:hypothetical protein
MEKEFYTAKILVKSGGTFYLNKTLTLTQDIDEEVAFSKRLLPLVTPDRLKPLIRAYAGVGIQCTTDDIDVIFSPADIKNVFSVPELDYYGFAIMEKLPQDFGGKIKAVERKMAEINAIIEENENLIERLEDQIDELQKENVKNQETLQELLKHENAFGKLKEPELP